MLSVEKPYPILNYQPQMWSCLLHPSRMSFTYTFPHRSRTGVGSGREPSGVKSLLPGKCKILLVSVAFSPLSGMWVELDVFIGK